MAWDDYFSEPWAPPQSVIRLVERRLAFDVTERTSESPVFEIGQSSDLMNFLVCRHPNAKLRPANAFRFEVRTIGNCVNRTVLTTNSPSDAVAAWRAAGNFYAREASKPGKYLVPSATVVDRVAIPFDVAVWRSAHPEYDLSLRVRGGYVVACQVDPAHPEDRVARYDDHQLMFFEQVSR